jgi:subtilisin-like proprotein convertase family protein
MNRRTLVLANLALLPSSVLAWPVSAQRRRLRRQQTSGAKPTARRRQTGGLTASHIQTRVVTRTFTSNVPLTIPAGAPGTTEGPATPYPSTLRVSGFDQGRILNVRVTLRGLSHIDPQDLDIMLVSPTNRGVILMSDVGDNDDVVGITLVFDQNAPGRLTEPLTSGTFQPVNDDDETDPFPAPAQGGVTGHSLTRFHNTNPNGSWRLFVVDDSALDTGSLGGWSLTIKARVQVRHRHPRRR